MEAVFTAQVSTCECSPNLVKKLGHANDTEEREHRQPKKKPIQKKWAALRKKSLFFVEFVFSARGRKLIHDVKELKDVGERNIQLEQTKQI